MLYHSRIDNGVLLNTDLVSAVTYEHHGLTNAAFAITYHLAGGDHVNVYAKSQDQADNEIEGFTQCAEQEVETIEEYHPPQTANAHGWKEVGTTDDGSCDIWAYNTITGRAVWYQLTQHQSPGPGTAGYHDLGALLSVNGLTCGGLK